MRFFYSLLLLLCTGLVYGQLIPDPEIPEELRSRHWDASWVKVPETGSLDYGVYLFRNEFEVLNVEKEFIIHVSADNRYKLFVNGKLIGVGPARSEPSNWIYESYDLSKYLIPGRNTIAAQVWNFGEYKPYAQMTVSTGFLVQGNSSASSVLNTPGNWKCIETEAYRALETTANDLGTFIVVGPGDEFDGRTFPWAWNETGFNDSNWKIPLPTHSATPRGVGTDVLHALVPRTIPAMELRKIGTPRIRKSGNSETDETLSEYVIPANSTSILLLDQSELVTAYPELRVTGGKDAQIRMSYAESLFENSGRKPHRDSIRNMQFKGISDIFHIEGSKSKTYTTLWFRTFRYIQLEITTKEVPLVIETLQPLFTAYPFEEKGYFKSNNETLNSIWETGWRTQRLCANETYYDCPYYEQLQYAGDTRIQALVSLYVSGDDRLMKKAITDYYNSFIPEGLTQSRYPSDPEQLIPTFSLIWISMMYDYLWNRNDYMFIAQYLTNIQQVLRWFENRIDEGSGMIGPLVYWPFVDWTNEWPWDNEKRIGGVPPGGQEGNSSIITLQYALTLKQASEIFSFFGLETLGKEYKGRANSLIEATRKLCWSAEKNMFADTPEQISFSQHANSLAVLCNAVPKKEQALFMEDILRNKSIVQASYYFRFYLYSAAINAGLGNKYISWLGPWKQMLDTGLTTFAETMDTGTTRSDCHAWSSSPVYEFLNTVAGIQSAEPGFGAVLIAPRPGDLKWIKAGVPHYLGDITVDFSFDDDGGIKGSITLPQDLSGTFIWDNQTVDLHPGKQKISMKSLDSKFQIR